MQEVWERYSYMTCPFRQNMPASMAKRTAQKEDSGKKIDTMANVSIFLW